MSDVPFILDADAEALMTEETGAPEIAPWRTPYPLGFEAIDEDQDWLDRRLWRLAATEHAEDSGGEGRPDDSGPPRAQVIWIDIAQQRSDLLDVLDGVISCLTVVNDALESVLPNRKDRKRLSLFHSVLRLLGGG
jgi:hypothetical protein